MAITEAAAQDVESCSVTRLRGPATVLRDGGILRLTVGAGLRADDQLVTGSKARLLVTCAGGVDVTIGADTSVSIRALSEPGGLSKSLLELVDGILRIALAPHFNRERIELRTPTAVAAARSTAWITEAGAAGTAVFVTDGVVAVRSLQTGDVVQLSPGFGTDVALGAAPTSPARWGQNRVAAATRRISFP